MSLINTDFVFLVKSKPYETDQTPCAKSVRTVRCSENRTRLGCHGVSLTAAVG